MKRVISTCFLFICVITSSLPTESAALEKLYTVDSSGWTKKEAPEGDVYICTPCKKEIRLEISFGPEMNNDDKRTYLEMEKKLSNTEYAKQFANTIVKSQIPLSKGVEIDIENTTVGRFFNLNMVEFAATVYIGNAIAKDTTFVGLNGNRIVKVTVNYFDGSLDEISKHIIDAFFGSLAFISPKGK